jgi:hypothetical protein
MQETVMRAAFAMSCLFTMTLLSGCGGGSSSPPPPPAPVAAQSVGGIWKTQYTVTSGVNTGDVINAEAIATETGEFYYAGVNANNGCAGVGFGQVSVNGTAISGADELAVVKYTNIPGINVNCTFIDGALSGTGTISGSISQRATLSITETETSSLGTQLGTQTTTWTFSQLYMQGSSFAAIAGNYTDGAATLTISSNGVISETNATTGCVITGQVTILNASYNAYPVSFSFSGCTTLTTLNGATVTGLAALDNAVTPNQLLLGARATVAGQLEVFAASLPKQ